MTYIVMEESSSYDDFQSNPIHAFTSKETAEEHKKLLETKNNFIFNIIDKRKSLKDEWIKANPRPKPTDENLLSKPIMSAADLAMASSSILPKDLKRTIHKKHNAKINIWKDEIVYKWQCRMNKELEEALLKHFESEIKTFNINLTECLSTSFCHKEYSIIEIPLD